MIEQGVVRCFGTAQLPPLSAAPEVNQMAKLWSNLAASQAMGVGWGVNEKKSLKFNLLTRDLTA